MATYGSVSRRVALVGAGLMLLGGCASHSDRDRGGVFHDPFGVGLVFLTPATTEYPPYVICNGDRCGLLDKDGRFTQMSDEERNNYRLGIELAEERERLKDDSRGGLSIPLPSAPPPQRPASLN